MFACTTVHELTHLFVHYLSPYDAIVTPREISHLDYDQDVTLPGEGVLHAGESGRWPEAALFGGSLEYWMEHGQDVDQASRYVAYMSQNANISVQVGIPYIIDAGRVAYRIPLATIERVVQNHGKSSVNHRGRVS